MPTTLAPIVGFILLAFFFWFVRCVNDEHTEAWGGRVTQVQVKQVDLPQEMQRAIAKQAARPATP